MESVSFNIPRQLMSRSNKKYEEIYWKDVRLFDSGV